jgi:hypothetical protein
VEVVCNLVAVMLQQEHVIVRLAVQNFG